MEDSHQASSIVDECERWAGLPIRVSVVVRRRLDGVTTSGINYRCSAFNERLTSSVDYMPNLGVTFLG